MLPSSKLSGAASSDCKGSFPMLPLAKHENGLLVMPSPDSMTLIE
jgi:hypothetical protein